MHRSHTGDVGLVILWGEQRVEEVLLRTVFLQAAHQVADGHVEVFLLDHRGVQDHVARDVAHGRGLCRRHALQHLSVQLVLHVAGDGQLVGERQVVQVVRGHADAQVICVLGLQYPIQQADVVGIHLRLRQIGGLWPVVNLGIHALHGEVGALHQAHLDLGTALGAALRGELRQLLQRVEGVGQVGLQHDAGLKALELFLIQ